MGRQKRHRMPPFETEITALGKGGVGIGTAPDGKPVSVRPAPPGSRVHVTPMGRKKGQWQARRTSMIRPPASWNAPACAVFGLCGGCTLQELTLTAQRSAKLKWALGAVSKGLDTTPADLRQQIRVHPLRGADAGYGYRNKVELTFGVRQYVSEEQHRAGAPIAGQFLGFHAPGRFDRIVDTTRCHLISEPMNRVLTAIRETTLREDAPPPWDVRSHEGFWRHLLLREASATGQILVGVYTTSPTDPQQEQAVEHAIQAALSAELPEGSSVVGAVWSVNDGVASVARGTTQKTWGTTWLEERLGQTSFRLSPESFFQTSTAGAVLLYDTVGEALGQAQGTLYDLYCGIGSIGLYLADRFDHIIGIEEVEIAVADAERNAVHNGVENASFRATRMRDALEVLPDSGENVALIVDPPRAGLHPKVAKALAKAPADVLVYVACNPASLGRDAAVFREGGWQLTDLWSVDLFPQTGHMEVVGRFIRD